MTTAAKRAYATGFPFACLLVGEWVEKCRVMICTYARWRRLKTPDVEVGRQTHAHQPPARRMTRYKVYRLNFVQDLRAVGYYAQRENLECGEGEASECTSGL